MAAAFKIDEFDHFYRAWEDLKNGLSVCCLNDDVELWLDENITDEYDLNCDDLYDDSSCSFAVIEFTNDEDAMAFKLRWL